MSQTIQTQAPKNKKDLQKLKEQLSNIIDKMDVLDLINVDKIINKITYYVATKTNNLMSKGDIFIKTEKIDAQFNKSIETNWFNQTRGLIYETLTEEFLSLLLELDDNKLPIYGETLTLTTDKITMLNVKNSLINSCKISVNEGDLLLTGDGTIKPKFETKTGLYYQKGSLIDISSKYGLINLQMCSATENFCKIYVEYSVCF